MFIKAQFLNFMGVLFMGVVIVSALNINLAHAQDWIDIPLSEHTYNDNISSYQEGTYQIPVSAYGALEFKLGLTANDTIVYHWEVDMAEPDLLTVEFHGHTDRVENEPGTVMFYKIHSEGSGSGTLTAPFSGIHGWYLNNQSDEQIIVTLTVAGFYSELE